MFTRGKRVWILLLQDDEIFVNLEHLMVFLPYRDLQWRITFSEFLYQLMYMCLKSDMSFMRFFNMLCKSSANPQVG